MVKEAFCAAVIFFGDYIVTLLQPLLLKQETLGPWKKRNIGFLSAQSVGLSSTEAVPIIKVPMELVGVLTCPGALGELPEAPPAFVIMKTMSHPLRSLLSTVFLGDTAPLSVLLADLRYRPYMATLRPALMTRCTDPRTSKESPPLPPVIVKRCM